MESENKSSLLDWDSFEIVKKFVTEQLNILGFKVALENWEDGAMAYDMLHFTGVAKKYHMFISCRDDYKFGFGICDRETAANIFNASIAYDSNYQANVMNALDLLVKYNVL